MDNVMNVIRHTLLTAREDVNNGIKCDNYQDSVPFSLFAIARCLYGLLLLQYKDAEEKELEKEEK